MAQLLTAGNDTINVSVGGNSPYLNDTVDGLGGIDTIVVDAWYPSFQMSLSTTGDGVLTLTGASGSMNFVNFEKVKFSNVSVNLGTAGNDKITGTSSDDSFLYGLGGNDTIDGGAGNDTICGGWGKDFLKGGLGHDTFIFNTAPSAANADKISDYNAPQDTIELENSVYTALGAATGVIAAAKFCLGTAAHKASDRIIYDQKTGSLYYDADGSGHAHQVLIATLTNHAAITKADILII